MKPIALRRAILVTALLAAIAMLAASCGGHPPIYGRWESPERQIIFAESMFEIRHSGTKDVLGFRGRAEYRPRDVVLHYDEYLPRDSGWTTLAGTDLEGFSESMRYWADARDLRLVVRNTGKEMRFVRSSE